jgi:putative hydrolase of the HAD superfamily
VNIVFDFGGVLFNWQPTVMMAQTFPAQCPTPQAARALGQAMFGHPDWQSFDQGTVAMDDVIARAALRLNLPHAPLHGLVSRIGELLTPLTETVAVLERLHALRAKHPDLRLYYLSNMPVPYARVLEQRHAFLRCFDGGVFSGDVQLIKPNAGIYHLLQTRFALVPERTVFIDDLAHNIAAAQRCGWAGVQFESAQQLAQALQALPSLNWE